MENGHLQTEYLWHGINLLNFIFIILAHSPKKVRHPDLVYPFYVRAKRIVIQDCINAKNFNEFTHEFKSQDLRQLNEIKKTDNEF